MTEIREEKKAIREKIKAERMEISAEEKERLDAAICEKFLSLASYRYAGILLLYAPMKGEIDVMPLARAALAAGKKVAFPRCDPDDRTMVFRCVRSEEELAPAHFGIREPSDGCEAYDPASNELAICIVPALAFDREGFRVGYGGGYYDRFLNDFRGSKVGLIYSRFLIERAPRGRFDTAADAMVTEKGVITPCPTKR
ncbi:MAG: 5-formyltetrahydrofolate cyclo-ligase [Clostridia bacterium]|nr:5-formyltetrahydrofolate cyclo-ligase [Clostridia bacterium]